MMTIKRLLSLAMLGLSLVAFTCAPAQAQIYGGIYVQFGPPAPIVEPVPPPPAPYYVWVPGYWRWDGARYVWSRGRYARPPRGYAVWAPGRWMRHGHEWYWQPGRWEHGRGHGRGHERGARERG